VLSITDLQFTISSFPYSLGLFESDKVNKVREEISNGKEFVLHIWLAADSFKSEIVDICCWSLKDNKTSFPVTGTISLKFTLTPAMIMANEVSLVTKLTLKAGQDGPSSMWTLYELVDDSTIGLAGLRRGLFGTAPELPK
jgi:hypothetical protein